MGKICSKCGELKKESEFYRNKTKKDGLQPQCKNCKKEYNKQNKEQIAKQQRQYRKQNKERIAKHMREYYKQNKPQIEKQKQEYRKTPKGKLSIKRGTHNRRALIKNTETTLTLEQWNIILKQQKNRCVKCEKRFTTKNPPTVDHIIPLSKGGGLTFENCQALCHSCNSKKSNKLHRGFIQTWCVIYKPRRYPQLQFAPKSNTHTLASQAPQQCGYPPALLAIIMSLHWLQAAIQL